MYNLGTSRATPPKRGSGGVTIGTDPNSVVDAVRRVDFSISMPLITWKVLYSSCWFVCILEIWVHHFLHQPHL